MVGLIFHPNASEDYRQKIYWQNQYTTAQSTIGLLRQELSCVKAELIALKYQYENIKRKLLQKTAEAEVAVELQKENQKLTKLLNKRNGNENPYKSNTPSSKQVNKKNSSKKNQQKKGGAKKGHKGYGRSTFSKLEADDIIKIPISGNCECGGKFEPNGIKERCVIEFIPSKITKIIYEQTQGVCADCKTTKLFTHTGAMERYMYSNNFIANILSEHFFYGQTAGRLCEKYNINHGTFHNIAHNVADLLRPVISKIEDDFLQSLVKYADETTWSTDGVQSWAYGFFSDNSFLFKFRHTRGKIVPQMLFGENHHPGVLVRDRYAAYNFINIRQQYCYSHLIRNVEDLKKEFSDDKEVCKFVDDLIPLLTEAIRLKKKNLPNQKHRSEARKIKNNIKRIISTEAEHPGIQNIQNIFRENEHRVYQWCLSPKIPAENNFAERAWRPTVIARKISFGSQSEKGRLTREVLMSFLVTAKKRFFDPAAKLKEFLDLIIQDKSLASSFSL
jgi:transposase